MQILMSPTHPSHRKVMHDTYGIPKVDNALTSKHDSQVTPTHALCAHQYNACRLLVEKL